MSDITIFTGKADVYMYMDIDPMVIGFTIGQEKANDQLTFFFKNLKDIETFVKLFPDTLKKMKQHLKQLKKEKKSLFLESRYHSETIKLSGDRREYGHQGIN